MTFSTRFCTFLFLGALQHLTPHAQSIWPLLGPDFPPPKNVSSSKTFQSAASNFTQLLQQAISTGNTSYGLFDSANTSYSIELFSIYESAPLFTTHFTSPAVATYQYGVKSVDSNTVFRIGSLTKLFTVYTFLIEAGDARFNDPVVNYVPELLEAAQALDSTVDSLNNVAWDDITVGELASHMADIGRDWEGLGTIGGIFFPVDNPLALGLPPLNASEKAVCAGGPFCTRAQFFEGFPKRHPVYASSTAPIYSNVAFQILGYALENITGAAFITSVNDTLFSPLKLTGSSWAIPTSNSSGIIPDGSSWGFDTADETPAGGMFSSTNDLTSIGRSILGSTLIKPAITRRWLKPRGFVSNPFTAVGAPWEIIRLQTSPNSRIVDLYTKEGDLPGYSSQFVLIPDYNIGFSILSSGANPTTNNVILADMITDTILPSIETAAREEVDLLYTGTYTSPSKDLNSSITINTDATKPGLGVTSWISNGTNMINSPITAPDIRLYPTGLKNVLENGDLQVGFRASYPVQGLGAFKGNFELASATWVDIDSLYWGTVGNDEFLITVGPGGVAKSVTPRIMMAALERI
ncbi:putative beta-lactamase [Stipitochalara longipes BDJ]|nr:putative beta-lactamase [Stipitochalara longipes BDJ]